MPDANSNDNYTTEKPKLIGAYEKGGLVCLDYDNRPMVMLTWRQAIERIAAIRQSEQHLPPGRRELSIKAQDDVIVAAVEARRKAQPDWRPKGYAAHLYAKRRPTILIP